MILRRLLVEKDAPIEKPLGFSILHISKGDNYDATETTVLLHPDDLSRIDAGRRPGSTTINPDICDQDLLTFPERGIPRLRLESMIAATLSGPMLTPAMCGVASYAFHTASFRRLSLRTTPEILPSRGASAISRLSADLTNDLGFIAGRYTDSSGIRHGFVAWVQIP